MRHCTYPTWCNWPQVVDGWIICCQGPVRAGGSLGERVLGDKKSISCKCQGPIPWYSIKTGRAGTRMTAGVTRSRSEVKLGMRKSGAGSGPETLTSIRYSPVITRQVCSDGAGPRPSWEVRLWVHDLYRGLVNRAHGQAQAWVGQSGSCSSSTAKWQSLSLKATPMETEVVSPC